MFHLGVNRHYWSEVESILLELISLFGSDFSNAIKTNKQTNKQALSAKIYGKHFAVTMANIITIFVNVELAIRLVYASHNVVKRHIPTLGQYIYIYIYMGSFVCVDIDLITCDK